MESQPGHEATVSPEDVMREYDTEVAHATAIALDQLIRLRVLTPEVVSHANNEQIDEFIDRILIRFEFDTATKQWHPHPDAGLDDINRKIRRIFGLEHPDRHKEKGPDREQLIAVFQEILNEWQDPNLLGFVLHGSRMDPRGQFDPDSDIDVAIVGEYISKKRTTNELIDRLREKGVSPQLLAKEMIDLWSFGSLRDPVYNVWRWQPEKTLFISREGGTLRVGPERNIVFDGNKAIQDAISSDEAKKYRSNRLQRIHQMLREAGDN